MALQSSSGMQDCRLLGSVHLGGPRASPKTPVGSRVSTAKLSTRRVRGGYWASLQEGGILHERSRGRAPGGGGVQKLFFQLTPLFYPESLGPVSLTAQKIQGQHVTLVCL